MKKPLIIYPFLFVLFPVLFLVSYNIDEISIFEPLSLLVAVLIFTAVFILLVNLFLKNSMKSSLIVFIFFALFFSYGHIYDLIQDWEFAGFVFGRHRYLMFIWGLLFCFDAYFIAVTRRGLRNLTRILNLVTLFMFTVLIINIAIYKFKIRDSRGGTENAPPTEMVNERGHGGAVIFPDIYYIILDGYARADTLKEIFNYANTEFIEYLAGKGFYIASESRSNYASTFLSLASSLNMEYINYLSNPRGKRPNDLGAPYRMVRNNKVVDFLKSKGYKFILFGSGWDATDHSKYANLEFHGGRCNEFLAVLIRTTMLRPFEFYLIKDDARKRLLYTFSELSEIPKIPGKKFIFAHIVCPHPPFVFGEDGEVVLKSEAMMGGYAIWGQKQNYLNQLIFLNKNIKIIIDKLISQSHPPPIIILQADHGSISTFSHIGSNAAEEPTEDMLKERMRIFNAYYLPLGGQSLLYSHITPVNTFRLIFKFYFNVNYELLDDQVYYSDREHPFDFINVTDLTRH